MQAITRFLKGLFNFFVGDWIILGGVALTLVVAVLLKNLAGADSFSGWGGYLLFAGMVLTLLATLRREIG